MKELIAYTEYTLCGNGQLIISVVDWDEQLEARLLVLTYEPENSRAQLCSLGQMTEAEVMGAYEKLAPKYGLPELTGPSPREFRLVEPDSIDMPAIAKDFWRDVKKAYEQATSEDKNRRKILREAFLRGASEETFSPEMAAYVRQARAAFWRIPDLTAVLYTAVVQTPELQDKYTMFDLLCRAGDSIEALAHCDLSELEAELFGFLYWKFLSMERRVA